MSSISTISTTRTGLQNVYSRLIVLFVKRHNGQYVSYVHNENKLTEHVQQHIECLLLNVTVSSISAIVMTGTSLQKEHIQQQSPLLSVPHKLQRTKTRYNNDRQADGKLSHVLVDVNKTWMG